MQTYHHSFKWYLFVWCHTWLLLANSTGRSVVRLLGCCWSGERKSTWMAPLSNRLGSVKQRFILIISIDPPDAVYWRNHSSIGLRNSNSWARLYLSSSPGRGIQIQMLHQNCHCCTAICKREIGEKRDVKVLVIFYFGKYHRRFFLYFIFSLLFIHFEIIIIAHRNTFSFPSRCISLFFFLFISSLASHRKMTRKEYIDKMNAT